MRSPRAALTRRAAQAARNLLDAPLASDEGALSHIQVRPGAASARVHTTPVSHDPARAAFKASPRAPRGAQAMSAAVAEVDDVAAVALSMARLSVLDDAEARLEALRHRQRAMVDSLLAQARPCVSRAAWHQPLTRLHLHRGARS